jgi:outer membrane protein assembly factor BamB
MRPRRTAARVLAALLLVSCSGGTAPLFDSSEAWTMYQRTADHNAVVPRSGFTHTWKLDAGGQINGGMAVRGDVLYVDTLAGDLLAVDLGSGRVIWRAHAPHSLMSTPVFSGDLVYVGSGTAQLPDGQEPFWGKRDIVMGVRGGDAMYAYDARTGALRWSFRTRGQDMPSPAVVGNVLVFANGDFHAYGLDARTGNLLWKRALPGMATMASTTPAGDRAFISTCRYVLPYHCSTFALEPRSGRILWQAPYGNADASPTYAQSTVFVSGLDYTRAGHRWTALQEAYAVVTALDPQSGKVKWVYRDTKPGLPSDVGTAERAIAGTYADGKYFQALPGRSVLLAFDAKNGAVLWQFRSLAPIKMSPLHHRNILYAGGNEGVFYSLNASTGKLLQLRTFRQPFSCAPPLLVGDTMLVATDRFVHALPVSSLTDHTASSGPRQR